MSVLIDTGVFVAVQNDRDHHHDAATGALAAVLAGEFGAPYTTDYVYDEAVTLARERTGTHREARLVGDRIAGRGSFPGGIELLIVTRDRFERTVRTFEGYDDHDLNFTDASLVSLIENDGIDAVLSFDDDFDGIDAVLSFDDDFDGIVDRIDPRSI